MFHSNHFYSKSQTLSTHTLTERKMMARNIDDDENLKYKNVLIIFTRRSF